MKRLLTILAFMATALICNSQNGGQFLENNVVKVGFIEYTTGNFHFRVISKQPCTAFYRANFLNTDTVISIGPLDSIDFNIGSFSALKFKAKAEQNTTCINQPDMGWVEVQGVLSALPVKFTSFKATKLSDGRIKLVFDYQQTGSNTIYVTIKDGDVWKRIAVIPNGQKEFIISLK